MSPINSFFRINSATLDNSTSDIYCCEINATNEITLNEINSSHDTVIRSNRSSKDSKNSFLIGKCRVCGESSTGKAICESCKVTKLNFKLNDFFRLKQIFFSK